MRFRPPTPTLLAALCAAPLLGSAPSAAAQDAATLRTRTLAASCAQCHGSDGRTPPGSAIAALAALPAPYFTEQMQAFKTGVRPGSVMPQIAKGYSDEQIARLAAYFAQTAAAVKP